MMSKKTFTALLNWQPLSDRIISARFSSKVRNITIIQCYAPTELAEDNEKDEFYSRLNVVYGSTPLRDIVIVMGDLNAKVGVGNSGVEYVVGRHGVGVRNDVHVLKTTVYRFDLYVSYRTLWTDDDIFW